MDSGNKKHGLFLGALLLLVVVLSGYILTQEQIRNSDETTILRTMPIDPRDLLRGEYVTLRYEIARDEQVQEVVSQSGGEKSVCIGLIEDQVGVASVSDVYPGVCSSNDEGLWISGEINGRGVRFPEIEQYFVPEGTGLGIERLRSDVSVEISLLNGRARVLRLLDANFEPIDPEDYLEQ